MDESLGVLDLKSGGPWFKSSTLLLSGFVSGSPNQLGFLIVFALFAIYLVIYLQCPQLALQC